MSAPPQQLAASDDADMDYESGPHEKKSKKKKKKNKKRKHEPSDATEEPAGRKQKSANVHLLNTNVSVKPALKWSLDRSIRELLLNCKDVDSDATVRELEADNGWLLTNRLPVDHDPFNERSFVYSSNEEKAKDRLKNGKYGYGLKDAVTLLTAENIGYRACSPSGTFTAAKMDNGDVYLTIDSNTCTTDTVEQQLWLLDDCKVTAPQLKKAVKKAKRRCIAFRDLSDHQRREVVVPDSDEEEDEVVRPSAVYLPPETQTEGCTELFVHGSAYQFVAEDRKKPLALIYSMALSNKSIQGRDRVGLPLGWGTTLTKLIKSAPVEVLDYLVSLRERARSKFYEFGNQNINKILNSRLAKVRRNNEAQAARALEIREEAERAIAAHQKVEERIRTVQSMMTDSDDVAEVVVEEQKAELLDLQQGEEKSRVKMERLQRKAAEAEAAVAALKVRPEVLVLAGAPAPADRPDVSYSVVSTNVEV